MIAMVDIQSIYQEREDADFEFFDIKLEGATDEELVVLSAQSGAGLSLEEMKSVREYYKGLGRKPTDLELQALGQAWSEHACYKTSIDHLKENIVCIEQPDVILRGDAGVMRIDDEYVYSLRIESHNHPSAIEPYGGAATGIGGIVRDVLAMGCQPVALIDPLFFGPLDKRHEDLPKGTKHPKYLLEGVVSGIRDYGNRLGIPTVSGGVFFHPGYIGNCLVNVGCVGVAKRSNVMENRVGGVGDLYLLAGGKTGRDGIHGVTFASAELSEESEEESMGAVQLGDPIMEEPVIHATLECIEKGLATGLKDLGGGGLSCVIGEMALDAGHGAEVWLDKVPLKEEGMKPWEIWISESQERMMLTVTEGDLEKVQEIFDLYDVESTVVAKVIPEKKLRIWFHDVQVANTDLEFIYDAPVYQRKFNIPRPQEHRSTRPDIGLEEIPKMLTRLMSDPNLCSRSWVIRQYDHEVRGATAVKPFMGLPGHMSPMDAAVMKPIEDRDVGLAIAVGMAPYAATVDPYRAGKLVIDETCRNLASVGARPHSLTNCLNFGNPEKQDRMGEFVATVRGMGDVAKVLNLPVPSGNVSFYNEAMGYKVPPTAVVLGVGLIEPVSNIVTGELKKSSSELYHLGPRPNEMGGSMYNYILGYEEGSVPDVEPKLLMRELDFLSKAYKNDLILSAHDISDGGIATAAAEMSFGSQLGVELDISGISQENGRIKETGLFGEGASRWLLESEKGKELNVLARDRDIPLTRVGTTIPKEKIIIKTEGKAIDIDKKELYQAWEGSLWERM